MSVASGRSRASSRSYEWERRSQYRPDGRSSTDSQETLPPPQGPNNSYYGGPPLWYYSSQNGGTTTRCSDRDGRPKIAPRLNQATQVKVQGNHTRTPQEEYTRHLQFVGLQVANTAVEIPRLHGAVWGHPTRTTGVGPMEHREENGTRVPHLVPTAQAVWITNRRLPNGPDYGSTPTGHHKARENGKYMTLAPTENKPLGTVPVKITTADGRPDVLHLPIMPHLMLQCMPGASSTYMFHHVAWLFWPAPAQDNSRSFCSQCVQVAPRSFI